MHPTILFLQTHFNVSKLYSVWSWNIPWSGWWYESVSLQILPIKSLLFVGYPAVLALGAMKMQTLLPSLLWICLVLRLVYPSLILNTILTNIFFPLGKMIGMLRSWTSYILSSRSWEIARIGDTNLSHSYTMSKDPPPRCEHILVECNHFAKKKKGCRPIL